MLLAIDPGDTNMVMWGSIVWRVGISADTLFSLAARLIAHEVCRRGRRDARTLWAADFV
jgi:hypothetical protein